MGGVFRPGLIPPLVQKFAPYTQFTSQCHPDDFKVEIQSGAQSESAATPKGIKGFVPALKIFFNAVRMREGFFVCEMTNPSAMPAYVYVQINRSGFYGGSGFIGFAIRILSSFLRWFHLPMDHH